MKTGYASLLKFLDNSRNFEIFLQAPGNFLEFFLITASPRNLLGLLTFEPNRRQIIVLKLLNIVKGCTNSKLNTEAFLTLKILKFTALEFRFLYRGKHLEFVLLPSTKATAY